MTPLIYPRLCLHCKTPLDRSSKRFCKPCTQLFDLIPTQYRCSQCFSEIREPRGSCHPCRKRWAPLRRVAACFDSFGPGGSLLRAFKEGRQCGLAKDIAAFMVIQLKRQDWITPDFIISMPQPNWKKMWRGFNQSLLLASEIGKLLQLPVIEPLKRRVGYFSSHLLDTKERVAVEASQFTWKKKVPDLDNRVLLLVDDQLVTGATLRAASARLRDKDPRAVYALTFCGCS